MSDDRLSELERALDYHQSGQLEKAAEIYNHILKVKPNHQEALYRLSAIAYQTGDDKTAFEHLQRVIVVDPECAQTYNLLGLVLARRNQLSEAEATLRKALLYGRNAQIVNNLGTVLQEQGVTGKALECYQEALQLDPGYATAHYNMGNAYRAANDLDSAIKCYRDAIRLCPDSVDALAALGGVLNRSGHFNEALLSLTQATRLQPGDANLHCEVGDSLQHIGSLEQAKIAYQKALELDSHSFRAWYSMGCVESAAGEYANAIENFQYALRIEPKNPRALHNCGQGFFKLGQAEVALGYFRNAIRYGEEELPRTSIAVMIPGCSSVDNQLILDERKSWAQRFGEGNLVNKQAYPDKPTPRKKHVRIGYVSSFFQDANWMKPVWGVINHHDRKRFRIYLFSDAKDSQIKDGYNKHPTDCFYDISKYSNKSAAKLISENEIDILVDLNGYSKVARLPLFAFRPAPIILGWFNMYATTGMSCFDYLVGDHQVIPADEELFYREKIIRVPGTYLAFEVSYSVPKVVPPPCLSAQIFTFGSLSSQYKVTTEVIGAWSKILKACSNSRLIVKNSYLGSEGNRQFLHGKFADFGVERERVELQGPSDHFRFLETYNEIDVALDTFPYNGGTTTTEAIWQGVPMLTFYGDRWVSRTSASLLRAGNLSDYVAADLDDYINKAIHFATSAEAPKKLERLRKKMRSCLVESPACDSLGLARSLEYHYERIANH